jgi:hypothetical protein
MANKEKINIYKNRCYGYFISIGELIEAEQIANKIELKKQEYLKKVKKEYGGISPQGFVVYFNNKKNAQQAKKWIEKRYVLYQLTK